MVCVNKYVKTRTQGVLEGFCLAGNFPEVEYRKSEDGGEGYLMMEFCTLNARFMKLIDTKLKEAGYAMGIFANKRDAKFRADVDKVVSGVTAKDVEAQTEKFRTMFD